MTQEQKAKAYDEAIERAKIWQNHLNESGDKDYADELEYIFPELKESEDEKIRNEICIYIGGRQDISLDTHNRWLDWLEKQGKTNPYSGVSFKYNDHTFGMCARDGGVEISMDGNLKAFVSSDASFVYPVIPQPNLALKSALEEFKEEKVDNANKVEQNLANSAKTCKKSQRMVSAEAKEALYDKPAWSEEDEEYLRRSIKATKEIYPATSNWLKSIKQRIKGE